MKISCILFYFNRSCYSLKEVVGSNSNDIFKLSNLADLYPNFSKSFEIKSFLSNISERVYVDEVKTQLQHYIEEYERYISQLELKRDELSCL